MPGAVKEPSKESTLDVSVVTMEASHPDDAEREPKPIMFPSQQLKHLIMML